MISTLRPLLLLFLSCYLLMTGYGLSNLLFPVRMQLESFATGTIGLILSCTGVGFLFGAHFSRPLLQRAGHVRVFAMCGSMMAVAALISGLFVTPWVLALMRFITGVCIICLSATVDGWLNSVATESNRGRLLATNQMVIMTAICTGQLMLNVASPSDISLFVVCGIMLSLSITPIVMSVAEEPSVADYEHFSLQEVWRTSPLGITTCFFAGIIYAAMMNMLPVAAEMRGISGAPLTYLMAAGLAGGMVLQFPVGMLSDRFDRRTVMAVAVSILIGCTACTTFLLGIKSLAASMLAIAVSTGISACLYPLSVAETLDKVVRRKMAAAMAALLMVYSIGCIIGPLLSSIALDRAGVAGFLNFLAIAQSALLAFLFYRITRHRALPANQQESYVMMDPTVPAVTELDPRTDYHVPTSKSVDYAPMLVSLAEKNPDAAVRLVKAMLRNDPSQAGNIAASLATVEKIDIGRLYQHIAAAAPGMEVFIAEELSKAKPEATEALVRWIAQEHPKDLAKITRAISEYTEQNEGELLAPAIESIAHESPAHLTDIIDQYVQDYSERYETMRPADRAAAQEEAVTAGIYSRITDVAPELASELAIKVTQAVPDAASEIAEAYAQTVFDKKRAPENATPEQIETLLDFVRQVTEYAPEQAVDSAKSIIEAAPEIAPKIANALQDRSDQTDPDSDKDH